LPLDDLSALQLHGRRHRVAQEREDGAARRAALALPVLARKGGSVLLVHRVHTRARSSSSCSSASPPVVLPARPSSGGALSSWRSPRGPHGSSRPHARRSSAAHPRTAEQMFMSMRAREAAPRLKRDHLRVAQCIRSRVSTVASLGQRQLLGGVHLQLTLTYQLGENDADVAPQVVSRPEARRPALPYGRAQPTMWLGSSKPTRHLTDDGQRILAQAGRAGTGPAFFSASA
jgi:hypothetical protein